VLCKCCFFLILAFDLTSSYIRQALHNLHLTITWDIYLSILMKPLEISQYELSGIYHQRHRWSWKNVKVAPRVRGVKRSMKLTICGLLMTKLVVIPGWEECNSSSLRWLTVLTSTAKTKIISGYLPGNRIALKTALKTSVSKHRCSESRRLTELEH
jgi:hypothetical protein